MGVVLESALQNDDPLNCWLSNELFQDFNWLLFYEVIYVFNYFAYIVSNWRWGLI